MWGKRFLIMYISAGVHKDMRLKEAAKMWEFICHFKGGKSVKKRLHKGKGIWGLVFRFKVLSPPLIRANNPLLLAREEEIVL